MNWIRTIAREIYGLFVDDGSFALSILVWTAVVYLLASHFAAAAKVGGVLLFVGLAAILAESTLRYARGKARLKR